MQAGNDGGAMASGGSVLQMRVEDTVFDSNTALQGGGASLFISDADESVVFERCQWKNNTARLMGGGIITSNGVDGASALILRSCTLTGNR